VLNRALVATAVEPFVIPAFVALTDRVGRRTLYLGSAVFAGLMAAVNRHGSADRTCGRARIRLTGD